MVEGESNSLARRLGRVTVPPGLGLESPADLDGRSELRRPGTPASPVKPMNSPLSRCSRAQRPKPLGSNRSSNSSMSASLSRRVSGAWKCSMTRGSAFIVANGTRSSSRQLRRSSRSVVSVVATGSGCPTDPTYADLLEQQAVVDPVGRRLPFCGLALTAISPFVSAGLRFAFQAFCPKLPRLPSRQAMLFGWTTPVPVLVEMRELADTNRPKSSDPQNWDVGVAQAARPARWGDFAAA
jgi:hypothetical protein